MIRTKLIVCARDIIRDAQTNVISAINIYEGLATNSFPMVLTPFCALLMLERDLDDDPVHDAHFQLTVGDEELLSTPMSVNFEDKRRTRLSIRIEAIVVPVPGKVTARFDVGKEKMAEYSFDVSRHEPPQPVVSSAPATT